MKKLLLLCLLFINQQAFASAHALYDFNAHGYIIAHNNHDIKPIASITKLITAATVLDSGVDLTEEVKVNGFSKGHVPNGVYMTRLDLMRAMLVSSDNRASEALANHHPGGYLMFVLAANKFLEKHNLYDTKVVDSSGLLPGNVSSVHDLIELLAVIKSNKIIRSIASERYTSVNAPRGKKIITINLHNTNPEIFTYDNILISKTGFTNPAGRCVLMLVEKNREEFGVVVLGQKNVQERTKLVKELLAVNPEPKIRPKLQTTIPEFEYETFTK